jgi:hypothetical protein
MRSEASVTQRTTRQFTETLRDIRGGDVVHELTEQLREVVTRVKDTGRPGSLILTLKVKPAATGAGTALIIEDDVKIKLPMAAKGATILYANDDGGLQRNDPRQPSLLPPPDPRSVVAMPAPPSPEAAASST